MLTDIEIAQNSKLLPIEEIAVKLNIAEADIDHYGKYIAKVNNYQKYTQNHLEQNIDM